MQTKIKSYLILGLLLTLAPRLCTCSSSIHLTDDMIESDEIQNVLDQEEYIMFLFYDSAESENYNQCLSTFHDLERNYSDTITFMYGDVSENPALNKFFQVPQDSTRSSGYMKLESCQWTLNVHGNAIGFHNESHSYESLNSWIEYRVSNQPKPIKTAKEFYDTSAKYFACIYGYMPEDDESPEQIERTKQKIIMLLQALSSEFPSSSFYYSFDPEVNKEVKMMKKHSFVIVRSFEDGHKSILREKLISFHLMRQQIAEYRFPFILWWNQEVSDFISQEQKNVTILIVRKRKNYQLEATFERIARMYDDQEMRYAILEIVGNKVNDVQKKLLNDLKITPKSNIPTLVTLYHDKSNEKVRTIKCDNMSEEGIKGFLDAQFGFESKSHCLQNQFLKKGWKYDYVKPLNFDLMMSLTSQVIPIPKVILFYRSKDKDTAPFVKYFIKSARDLFQKNANMQLYIFDERLNEPPQYLITAGASVPGVLFLLPEKVNEEGMYNPEYANVAGNEDIKIAFKKHLGVELIDAAKKI